MQIISTLHGASDLASKAIETIERTPSTSSLLTRPERADVFISSRPSAQNSKEALPFSGYTKLHDLTERCQVKEVEKLLQGGERKHINTRDQDGYTPLHIAAEQGHSDIVELLLGTHGIKPDIKTPDGQTAAELARDFADEFGDQTNARLFESNRNPLHHAVSRGRLDEMHHILRQTGLEHLNGQDKHGNTPLHVAAINGDLNAVRVLMGRKGIDTRTKDFDGLDAYALANLSGQWHVVKHLEKNLGITSFPTTMHTGGFFFKNA